MIVDLQLQKIKAKFLDFSYIKQEHEDKIYNFKYKGSSASLTYQYFWSPFCNYLTEKIPTSVAPNLITIFAFTLVFISHLILVYFSPDFKSQVPGPVLFLVGLTTISYQILDNMDGKQARRTGSSTPLGMLFDHFLDSITTWIFGINQIICFGAGQSSIIILTVFISCFIAFYTAQWSQYHIGALKLGKINAVDEGLMLVQSLFLFTSFVGVQFWQQNQIFGYKLNEIALIIFLFVTLMEISQFVINTLKESNKEIKQVFETQKISLLLLLTGIAVACFSPTQVLKGHYCYIFLVTMGLLWSKSTLHLQIAHLADDQKFNQFRKSFVTVCVFFMANIFSQYFTQNGKTIMNEKNLIYAQLCFSLLVFLHTVISVTKQMSRILNIQVFSLEYLKHKKISHKK
ncbi:hypothetical protein PPERSA_01270 [Pseudocohnilembus persalinus]|uniref:CDP-alcohol phosphatidyltransferase n=1 Tax=Pseudocohnilembus persalinus TaxID=266149 RepID=A0A0V0QGQ5_PSEPJ|nr:hypothetical protein PPERSA_01270 [Pseudocohnilembus persalinus]|eukprot:KRX01367.1 hypothetical protein PPERSA_01270 [Pseudocohnilembus persalinus]